MTNKKVELDKVTQWVIYSKIKNAIWLYPFHTKLACETEYQAQMARLTMEQREKADWKIQPFYTMVKRSVGKDEEDEADKSFGEF